MGENRTLRRPMVRSFNPTEGTHDVSASTTDVARPDVAPDDPRIIDLRGQDLSDDAATAADASSGTLEGLSGQDVLDVQRLPGGARGALEAVLMVTEEPIDEARFAAALGLPIDEVARHLAELALGYSAEERGFELRRVAGGWRIYSRSDYVEVVQRFLLDGQTSKLSQAALETLAIVAYRQPVSRVRVGGIRGVNVDAVMRTLVSRNLVEEAGQDHESGAVLYRTTDYFLQRVGLTSLAELPELAPYLPDADVIDELMGGGAG